MVLCGEKRSKKDNGLDVWRDSSVAITGWGCVVNGLGPGWV